MRLLLLILLIVPAAAVAAQCTASSGRGYRRAGRAVYVRGLLELPARRPLARLPGQPIPRGQRRAARLARRLLGLHRLEGSVRQARVFAAPAQVQPAAAHGLVYTPQVVLQGRDFRALGHARPSTQAVAKINAQPARAKLRLAVDERRRAGLGGRGRRRARPGVCADADLYLAAYQQPPGEPGKGRRKPWPPPDPRLCGPGVAGPLCLRRKDA